MTYIAWMIGSLLSFCVMAVGARELSDAVSVFQMLLCRSVIGLLILTPFMWLRNGAEGFVTSQGPLHLLRNTVHFGGQYCWFFSIGALPLAQVFAIEFTVPLWSALMAFLFLREPFTRTKLFALVVGFVGVLVIVRPGSDMVQFGTLVMFGGALCFAVAIVCTKMLATTDSPLQILFYMCLMQLPMSLFGPWQWVWPSPLEWFWLILLGVTGLSAHFCFTRALQLSEVTRVLTIDFLRLPLIGLVGVLFYNEAFDIALLLGGLLMLGANYINVRH